MWRGFVVVAALALTASAEDVPRGQVVPDVKCAADASQSYALYLPSSYSPDKHWNLMLAFDPRGRGRLPVELYRAAAEKYGYILAGSNNSRNGPAQTSLKAAQAMLDDVEARFSINKNRMYVTGLSGGARFATDLAMGTNEFAGVIASSAGFAHSTGDEEALSFALFGTAGTEDFNYLEMRRLDLQVTSPHRVRIFVGDHAWPPAEVAMEAVEWMELQAMKSGRRARDEAFIDRIFAERTAQLAALTAEPDLYRAASSLAADFAGLRDVTAIRARATGLAADKDVKDALRKTAADEMNEGQMSAEILNFSDQLGNPLERTYCLAALRERLTKLSDQAKGPEDSAQRRMARRVLKGVIADNAGRADPDYRKLLDEVRP